MTAPQGLSVTPQLAVQVSFLRDLPGAKHHGSGQSAVKENLFCFLLQENLFTSSVAEDWTLHPSSNKG